MEITLTLKDIGLIAIGVGLIVLIIYLICVAKNLLETLKRTNRVLEDVEKISSIAAGRTEEIDGIISDVSEAATGISSALKGNQNIVSALTSTVNGFSSLLGLFRGGDKDEEK